MTHYKDGFNYIDGLTEKDILCFDIETTSFWVKEDGEVISYNKELSDEDYKKMRVGALCYIWMLSVNDIVLYGRELSEVKQVFDYISNNYQYANDKDRPIIYIHNLAYEFQFLSNYLEWENVFATAPRKPLKCVYNKIEFRCSYRLTNLSLAKWSEQTTIKKLVGALDYDKKLRTPKSELEEQELAYCEHDVLVMYEGLQSYIKTYKKESKIPLTQTGEVRQKLKKRIAKSTGYYQTHTKLVPKNANDHKILVQAFAGGDTHANMRYVGKTIYDVGSYDETSAYPAMCFRKKGFPTTRFLHCNLSEAEKFDFEKFCYIIGVRFYDVKAKGVHHYIAKSRMVAVKNAEVENGRVIKADYISGYMTEIDLQIIQKTYDIGRIEYVDILKSCKGYLPREIIDMIIELLKNKTEKKGIDDELYMKSKQMFNSTFGMMVYNPVKPSIDFQNGIWTNGILSDELIEETLAGLRKVPYKNYLAYQYGIYVTALNRQELWHMLLQIPTEVYHDTDSLKMKHPRLYKKLFDERNKEIIKENIEACRHYGIPEDSFIAYTPKGKKCVLGIWENEGDPKNGDCEYYEFKTLGAKKYAYRYYDKSIGITVAGVPKVASVCLKNIYHDFNDGFVFDRDICKKKLCTYIDGDNPLVTMPDGYVVKETMGINLRNIGYTLGMVSEFKTLLGKYKERGWMF